MDGIRITYLVGGLFVVLALLFFRVAVKSCIRALLNGHHAYNNIVIASCALLTLVWGAYTFDALEQRSKAVAELEVIQRQIKDTESTFLNVVVEQAKYEHGFYLTPVVTIKNTGNEAVYLRLCPDSMSVSFIDYNFDGKVMSQKTVSPNYYEVISSDSNKPNIPLYNVRIPVSSERSMSYFLPVKNPGVYYVTFSALSSSSEKNEGLNNSTKCSFKGAPVSGADAKDDSAIWFSSTYVIVK